MLESLYLYTPFPKMFAISSNIKVGWGRGNFETN